MNSASTGKALDRRLAQDDGADDKPIEILLVEDNPGDVRIAIEALKDCRVGNNLSVVEDGVEALSFLRREHGSSPK